MFCCPGKPNSLPGQPDAPAPDFAAGFPPVDPRFFRSPGPLSQIDPLLLRFVTHFCACFLHQPHFRALFSVFSRPLTSFTHHL